MMPEVSAGSNHVGASAKCRAHVIWPSGAAAAGATTTATISRTSVVVTRPRMVLMEGLLARVAECCEASAPAREGQSERSRHGLRTHPDRAPRRHRTHHPQSPREVERAELR